MWRFWIFFLLAGCANTSTLWKYDAIESQTSQFNCARLLYKDPQSSSPLRFEMTRIGYEISAYLNLNQYRLTSGRTIEVEMVDGEETIKEEIPLLQGMMRLRLSPRMTLKIAAALQEGRSVKLSVDGFEEVLKSENFAPLFHKLVKNSEFLQNIMQREEDHEST